MEPNVSVYSTKVYTAKCMYIKVKLDFRFPIVTRGREFRQGLEFRRCVEEIKGKKIIFHQTG